MKSIWLIANILILFLSICTVRSQETTNISEGEEEVPYDSIELTTDNFDQTVGAHDLILVFFYAPWCGACKKSFPEFEEAATRLKGEIPFAKVNAWEEKNIPITQRYNVSGYPTIVIIRKGDPTYHTFEGDRTADEFVKYMRIKARPVYARLNTVEEITTFASSWPDQLTIVGLFDTDSGEKYEKFISVAKDKRDDALWAVVISPSEDVKNHFGVNALPSIVLLKNFDEKVSVLPEEKLDSLLEWITDNTFPLVETITKANSQLYISSGIPLAFFFVENQEQKDQLTPILTSIAKDTRRKVNFVFIDWQKYGSQAKKFGLSANKVPCFALEDTVKKFHYAFDQSKELNEENIRSFVNQFLQGELQPTLVSEPLPDNSGPLKTLVQKNFAEIVNDNTKDVVVEFYAPWCGHCKKLAPIWEQIAVAHKDVPSLVIAKMDTTANDLPKTISITKYPTIGVFKANDKENPIYYEGKERTLEALTKFILDTVSIKFEIPSNKKSKHDSDDDDDDQADSDDDDDDSKKQKKEKKVKDEL